MATVKSFKADISSVGLHYSLWRRVNAWNISFGNPYYGQFTLSTQLLLKQTSGSLAQRTVLVTNNYFMIRFGKISGILLINYSFQWFNKEEHGSHLSRWYRWSTVFPINYLFVYHGIQFATLRLAIEVIFHIINNRPQKLSSIS